MSADGDSETLLCKLLKSVVKEQQPIVTKSNPKRKLDIEALWRRKIKLSGEDSSEIPTTSKIEKNEGPSEKVVEKKMEFKEDKKRGRKRKEQQLAEKRPKFEPVEPSEKIFEPPMQIGYSVEQRKQGSDPDMGLSYSPNSSAPYSAEFPGLDFPDGVNQTTYQVYGPETGSYPGYFHYAGNMQQSPQDNYLNQNVTAHSPASADEDPNGLNHTTRACPATVSWLLDNYETADGTSLPRCTLYDHYRRHCNESQIDAVNAASFGKLIRSVFIGLRTRRLGTRGNSKYHYYGIRIKPSSALNQLTPTEEIYHENTPIHNNNSHTTNRNYNTRQSARSMSARESLSPVYQPAVLQPQPPTPVPQQPALPQPMVAAVQPISQHFKLDLTKEIDTISIGDGQLPTIQFPNIEHHFEVLTRKKIDGAQIGRFYHDYITNCRNVMDLVKKAEFDKIENLWIYFWMPKDEHMEHDGVFQSETLSQDQMYFLCSLPEIQDYIQNYDIAFYQLLVDILVPDVLMSPMTPALTQACRQFAKNSENYMKKALHGAPETFLAKKVHACKLFQRGLKRSTSLNHLAQAANSVLIKAEQVHQMWLDYVRVEMPLVRDQASWVCGCDPSMVTKLSEAFRLKLQKVAPMHEWAEWLESIVDQMLAPYYDSTVEEITKRGKLFLLNWSFHTSMIIRDLTMRSAISFGSFHLIRLLSDEYMFYLIEARIAKAGNQPMITVVKDTADPFYNEPSKPESSVPSSYQMIPTEYNIKQEIYEDTYNETV